MKLVICWILSSLVASVIHGWVPLLEVHACHCLKAVVYLARVGLATELSRIYVPRFS